MLWLQDWFEVTPWPPTYREIALAFDWTSPNAAFQQVQRLRRAGLVTSLPKQSRSMQLTELGGQWRPSTMRKRRAVR